MIPAARACQASMQACHHHASGVSGDFTAAHELHYHSSVTAALHIVKVHPLARLHVQSM